MENSLYDKMTSGSVKKLLIKLAIPTVVSMLITAIYNIADTAFVSQMGRHATAAITVVFALQTLIQAVGFTLGMGCGALLSRLRGQQKIDDANGVSASTMCLGVVLGLILMIFGLIFTPDIMRLLGCNEDALDYAVDYSRYIFIATPLLIPSFIMNNILRSEGHSKLSMIGLGIGGLLNLGLDPLFIFGFNMGVGGAGCATMISQIFSFSILLSMFIFKISATRLKPMRKYFTPSLYWNVIKTGSPTLFRQGCATIAAIVLNYLCSPYGNECLAALGIASKIYLFVRNIVIGIGQGYQPILGYNYGAKKNDRIMVAFRFSLLLTTVVCLVAAVIVLAIPNLLIRAFTSDEAVIEIGINAIRFLAISLPFLGYSTIVNQSLQITGQSLAAGFLASLRQGLIYVPVIFLFNLLFGVTGLCLTQPISDVLTALISLPFMFLFFKVLKRNQ